MSPELWGVTAYFGVGALFSIAMYLWWPYDEDDRRGAILAIFLWPIVLLVIDKVWPDLKFNRREDR